jgi:hypothetical protein
MGMIMGYTLSEMLCIGRLMPIESSRRLGWCKLGYMAPLIAGLCACQPPPPPPVTITVRARSEAGTFVPNADVYAGAVLVARTDREGLARLDIRGGEGDTFNVRVDCPPGYRSPNDPLPVRRLAIAATASVPEYDIVCHELRHTMVVAVRAEGGGNLPVLYLGKEVARTDRSGAAHVTIAMDVHDRIELTLATAGKANEKIHPQNPASVFEMPDHDDIQVFPVTFTRDAPPKAAPRGGHVIRVF